MKIGIIGCRGIPNYYGGFEQFAEYLARLLVQKGCEVTVYNSHNHPYQNEIWEGVKIIHKYDPEFRYGTAGQFIYDLNCILDSRKRQFDIIFQLGYTSSSIWGGLLPRKKSIVVTNMDGFEWKRSKYNRFVRSFLLFAERLGVHFSDYLISDSIGIQNYLLEKYNVESTFIPYGTYRVKEYDESFLEGYGIQKKKYSMLVARLEPENNIEIILDGVCSSGISESFLVVGNHETRYGEYLKKKYLCNSHILFMGGIYDIKKLNSLRNFARIYFHGHSVGGTNPSLIEALGSGALICAHDNIFNRSILGEDALYFSDSNSVSEAYAEKGFSQYETVKTNNFVKVEELYHWTVIADQHDALFRKLLEMGRRSLLFGMNFI